MSSDMLDLIAQAGMLMEDGSAETIVIGDADDPLLMLERLRDDMRRLLLKVTLSLAAVRLLADPAIGNGWQHLQAHRVPPDRNLSRQDAALADPGSLSNACHQPQNVIYLLLR